MEAGMRLLVFAVPRALGWCLTVAVCTAILLEGFSTFPAKADDFSPIHGLWQIANSDCNVDEVRVWYITPAGASAWEEECKVRSVNRKGSTFTLKQRCVSSEGTENRTDQFRLTKRGELVAYGQRFRLCPPR